VSDSSAIVDDLALRHLDAAYNLGRWLLGNEHDAADAVHDAFLRASRSADTYAGGNARAWWLAIVRNCCLARIAARSKDGRNVAIDQVAREHGAEAADALLAQVETADAGDRIDDAIRRSLITRHLENLPAEFRDSQARIALMVSEIAADSGNAPSRSLSPVLALVRSTSTSNFEVASLAAS